MRATFVHTADNHLGYEQYGVKARFDDFARAFFSVVDDAIERRADLFVIAGDLFNKRAIDARTLMQARDGLKRLKEAGIHTVAIEGNHDRSYYRDGVSWLEFLAWDGLLTLLNPFVAEGVPQLSKWDSETMRGAYIDLERDGAKLRVYGLPWYGASTARIMTGFAGELAAAREAEESEGVVYRLLLMHTGVEGIVPQLHGLPTRADFEPLRGLVDYIALGHVHKSYEIDNWLYNPGSTETWGAEESAWERGFYVADVDTDVPEGQPRHTARHLVNPRRPFLRFNFNVEGITTPTSLYEHFERFIREKAREHHGVVGHKPVVDVMLTGVLGFDAGSYERPRLEAILDEHFDPIYGRVNDNTRDTDFDPDLEDYGDAHDRSTLHQLEAHVFQELLSRDARYAEHSAEWAKVLSEVKQLALTGDDPANIAQRLREAHEHLMK